METVNSSIAIVSIGGAGGNELNRLLMQHAFAAYPSIAFHTKDEALQASNAATKFKLEHSLEEPDHYRGDFRRLFAGHETILFLAGLGGKTGSNLLPVAAHEMANADKKVTCLVTMPFNFEGPEKAKRAESALAKLQTLPIAVHIFKNESIFDKATSKTTFAEAFEIASRTLEEEARLALKVA